jgi:hypothetical protein
VWRGGVQVEGKGFDGGRKCVALDILRQVGMGEWKVQVMLPVPNQFWPARNAASKAGPRTLAPSQKTVNPCPRPDRQHRKEHQNLRTMVFSVCSNNSIHTKDYRSAPILPHVMA